MAEIYDDPKTPGSKKPAKPAAKPAGPAAKPAAPTNPRLAEAQRRAQSMTKGAQVSPAQFFEEAWVELKKTSWPNQDTLIKSTTVVLALVVAVAVWVGGLDALLTAFTTHVPIFSAGR